MTRSSRAAFFGCVGAALILAFAVQPAEALPPINQYSHGSCPVGPGNRIDPVNVFWVNWGTWDRVVNHTSAHTAGWFFGHGNQTPGWESQVFADHGNCYNSIYHMANGPWYGSRYHFRLHPVYFDPGYGWMTLSDAHYDQVVWCGHAVPPGKFNEARDVLYWQYLGIPYHNVGYSYWGNTDPRPQCNGWRPASNGWTLYVFLHQFYH